jgi:hypothetical protein
MAGQGDGVQGELIGGFSQQGGRGGYISSRGFAGGDLLFADGPIGGPNCAGCRAGIARCRRNGIIFRKIFGECFTWWRRWWLVRVWGAGGSTGAGEVASGGLGCLGDLDEQGRKNGGPGRIC